MSKNDLKTEEKKIVFIDKSSLWGGGGNLVVASVPKNSYEKLQTKRPPHFNNKTDR